MSFAIISAEILRICRALSCVVKLIKTSKCTLHRICSKCFLRCPRQGVNPLCVKNIS